MKNVTAIGILVVGALGVYVVDEMNKSMNYQEAEARVVGIERECHLEKKTRRKHTWTDRGPCEAAEWLAKNSDEHRGMDVVYHHKFDVAYYAPGEDRARRSILEGEGEDYNSTRRNDTLAILVHNRDREKLRAK